MMYTLKDIDKIIEKDELIKQYRKDCPFKKDMLKSPPLKFSKVHDAADLRNFVNHPLLKEEACRETSLVDPTQF